MESMKIIRPRQFKERIGIKGDTWWIYYHQTGNEGIIGYPRGYGWVEFCCGKSIFLEIIALNPQLRGLPLGDSDNPPEVVLLFKGGEAFICPIDQLYQSIRLRVKRKDF